jgi:hypothetical protein
MARADLKDTWMTDGDVHAARVALDGFFKQHKMTIVNEFRDEIALEAGRGWWRKSGEAGFHWKARGGLDARLRVEPSAEFRRAIDAASQPQRGEGDASKEVKKPPGASLLLECREIHVEQGSQILTRLIGGWFVPGSWLPKFAMVKILQTEDGVRFWAVIEESLGFGLLDPFFKQRYQTYFERWMDDLRTAVHWKPVED